MKYDLEERTIILSRRIIKLCYRVPQNIISIPIINQLIKAGTSIGTNYSEANGASSRKDFKNKIYICKKEALETKYWLKLLAHTKQEYAAECNLLWKEAYELTLIFSKIGKSSQ